MVLAGCFNPHHSHKECSLYSAKWLLETLSGCKTAVLGRNAKREHILSSMLKTLWIVHWTHQLPMCEEECEGNLLCTWLAFYLATFIEYFKGMKCKWENTWGVLSKTKLSFSSVRQPKLCCWLCNILFLLPLYWQYSQVYNYETLDQSGCW